MPSPIKIHFDVHSIPDCDRFDNDPTDLTLCGMGNEKSPVTACEAEVTCRSCRRSRVFREQFPRYALAPTEAEVQRAKAS